MEFTLGIFEALLGISLIIVIGPVAQFVTLRVGFNGLRVDIRDMKKNIGSLLEKYSETDKQVAVHEEKLSTLEGQMKSVEKRER